MGARKEVAWIVTGTGCWECVSHCRDQYGYPEKRHRGRLRRLSRIIYEDRFGPIPPGLIVRHTCDNPACIRPEHFVLGTHAQNVADRVLRGRSARGIRNGRSKLTPAVVRLIRRSAEATKALARRYQVDEKTIRKARCGQTWKDV